jgi:hypothetical protein
MSSNLPLINRLVLAGFMLLAPRLASAQNAFSPGGNDYPIAGALNGDQTAPQATINATGGYLVWQANDVDGDGLGICAERLDANQNKIGPRFRVNSIGAYDQEQPQVAPLQNGGAVFVWQGGRQGFQKIYARFLGPTGTNFSTGDIRVNTYTNDFQITPSVATLQDGSVVVVWASYGQDGDMLGIFGQRFTAAGVTNGPEFQINYNPINNQRSPSVAALAGGGFVVTWVAELQRNQSSVDIYARMFNASGVALGNEFPVNTLATRICANPNVVASPDGGFAVAWSQRDVLSTNVTYVPQNGFQTTFAGYISPNSWDVFARTFKPNGAPASPDFRLNTFVYGDQYAPKLSYFGSSYLAVWTGLGQDGSMEGVFGQFFTSAAQNAGVEFQVNTAPGNRQIQPTVCSDGFNRFLVTWSSYSDSGNFNLFARTYELIRVSILPIPGGVRLSWNTRPGGVYQVQSSTNYSTWTNFGSPRTATDLTDSMDITSAAAATVYRVIRVQ